MRARLLEFSADEKRAVLKEHDCTEEELEQLIDRIKEWIIKADLPVEENARNKYRTALLNCKLSLERTKECLRGYYQIRTIYSNFFDMLVPNTKDYMLAKQLVKMAFLPKLSPDLSRIALVRIDDPQGQAPDGLFYELIPILNTELRISTEDYFLTNTIIIDLEGFGLKNVIKYTPTVNNILVHLMLSINLRLKGLHFLNAPPIMDKVMFLVKNFLPTKFFNKVHVHKNADTLYKFIPKECLPENYGGALRSLEQLHEDWCKASESQEEFFEKLLTVKCEGDLSHMKRQDNDCGFGTDGSFKKLAID
nr:unnamed protein product [Callosobruchus chinensis]